MCTRLLMMAAAMLVAATAFAQQNPTSTPGSDGLNPLGQNNAVNCADPLMAGSSLCTNDLNSTMLRGGYGGASAGSGIPTPQQGMMMTYTDETGRPTSRERSTKIPLPPEPLTEFQKFTAATTGMVLPVFGAELFQSVPSTFAPIDNAPVPPDYVIGPDDMVRLRVWGQINFNANLRVDRSGEVYVPQVGAVQVAGAHFSDLDQMLRAAVGKIFRNFDLSVQLGDIRSIQIYITGEGRRPGVYTVSSLSTLVDALFASGGPSMQGSMRHIEVRRGGSVVTEFDLYRLLIDGDKSKDTKLQPGDVVYIPPVGAQVAVLGSVRRPAIYEVVSGETIAAVLKDAGNITSLASDARASLERSVERTARQAMEVRLDTAGMATPMQDGDVLRVISMVSRFQKTVTLRGNTANPGRFAWHEGMRLSDLIPDKESLITRDYWWKRARLGLPAPEFEPVPALSALRQPTRPIDLPLAQQMIRRQTQPGEPANPEQPANATAGQTQTTPNPGAVQQNSPYYWDNSQSGAASDIYGQENGAAPSGQTAQQGSQQPNAQRQTGPRGGESALAEPDTNNEEPIGPPPARRTVVRLSVPEIDWSYAVIERLDPATLKTTLISFDLGKLVLQHDASQDLELRPGDLVSVFSQADIHVPLAEQTGLIRLEGEFVHAGTYSVQPGETLRSLVERAGGLTPNAYLYGSVFARESARVLQQRRMDEAIQAMVLQMQRGNLALAANPLAAGQAGEVAAAQASEQALVAQLQLVRATGRIVFTFKPDSKGTDVIPDVSLENGDTFLVPSVPSTVNAVGAVFNQNSFIYRPDARLQSYLQLAGGPTPQADSKHMFLIRANGAVVSREAVKSAWGNEFANLKLFPGDTIVVPDKSVKPSALRGFLALTQVFSQVMYGVAAASVVF